jgi:hypothetical protein
VVETTYRTVAKRWPGAAAVRTARVTIEVLSTTPPGGTAPDGQRSVEKYLVDRAHQAGAKALLMLGGDGSDGAGYLRSTADSLRPTFVDNLVDYLVAHDYDGVDLDWENCLDGESGRGESAGQTPVSATDAPAVRRHPDRHHLPGLRGEHQLPLRWQGRPVGGRRGADGRPVQPDVVRHRDGLVGGGLAVVVHRRPDGSLAADPRSTGVGGTILWTINYGYLPSSRTNPSSQP